LVTWTTKLAVAASIGVLTAHNGVKSTLIPGRATPPTLFSVCGRPLVLPAVGPDGADDGGVHDARPVSDGRSGGAGTGTGTGTGAGARAGMMSEASTSSGGGTAGVHGGVHGGVHYGQTASGGSDDGAVFEPLLRALDEHNVVRAVCAVVGTAAQPLNSTSLIQFAHSALRAPPAW
jgi:hypothetical protein